MHKRPPPPFGWTTFALVEWASKSGAGWTCRVHVCVHARVRGISEEKAKAPWPLVPWPWSLGPWPLALGSEAIFLILRSF